MRRVLAVCGLAFLVLVLSGLGVLFMGVRQYDAPGPLEEQRTLVVGHGGTGQVLTGLQAAGIVAPGWFAQKVFEAATVLTRVDGAFHAAELVFPAHASIHQVLLVLRHGKPVVHRLTVPEGLSAIQIANLLEHAPFMDGSFPFPDEGSVMPLTYDYEWGMPRAQMLARMQHAMDRAIDQAWESRVIDPAIVNRHDLLVLASMIERETAIASERPMVARVFLNRLHQGMRLQSDPTVVYGLNRGAGPLGHALSHADLLQPTAYNTYVIAGLPPGPICSPGMASLYAAAHPAEGEQLYFVANGLGGHDFTSTLEDHNHHVAAFRASRRAAQASPRTND
ncbi:aminodeoxychorismate lyase [Komagataeibacter nataicola]|uniref:Endolytic murein transglycosylase n=1 Tax=Komagataeibacter nataicola TaxID=265960 RepID=A0A9N7CAV5_9PROT|nr:endolytic transglycosylase MltG [Komagataeibacter nataicola]AQU88528.1 aminodeoxychorismate lyase [Komagataeibacter nataicola]PYD67225.1 aminodeoxychorismate lyase [Komagataeibacter nataicola]WEQ57166.1 endolytic transglycosylase MltG [Komagataeibacter nataicola]GBR16996.1 aminodeoxychorismate lyase [Komagataeibacter nataicola NRIC 0616]